MKSISEKCRVFWRTIKSILISTDCVDRTRHTLPWWIHTGCCDSSIPRLVTMSFYRDKSVASSNNFTEIVLLRRAFSLRSPSQTNRTSEIFVGVCVNRVSLGSCMINHGLPKRTGCATDFDGVSWLSAFWTRWQFLVRKTFHCFMLEKRKTLLVDHCVCS